MEDLLTLPGVGRKTANVILGNSFGKQEGIVVDTHVARVTQRLGLTSQKDPVRIEQSLMPLFPRAVSVRSEPTVDSPAPENENASVVMME